jgi:hypothetical protein
MPAAIREILPSADPRQSPRLSAILAISGPCGGGEKALRHLAAQTVAAEMEMIVATDLPENFEAAAPLLQQFGAVQRVVGDVRYLPHLRAACAMRARAPYVAFCEDHSFPEPTWAAELVAAFDSDANVVAVCPAMVNPNPVHPVSRAQFSAYFARAGRDRWAPGLHVVAGLPWHNTAYRADVLRAFGDTLGHDLEVEGMLQEQIVRRFPSSYFVLNTRVATHHVNVSRLWPACLHAFVGGRLYALERSARLGWSPLRRVVQALASPLVPFVRLARDRHLLNASVRGPIDAVNLWMHALIMALFHAAGEAAGCVLGPADLVPTYSNFECRRARFVRAADVMLLEP